MLPYKAELAKVEGQSDRGKIKKRGKKGRRKKEGRKKGRKRKRKGLVICGAKGQL